MENRAQDLSKGTYEYYMETAVCKLTDIAVVSKENSVFWKMQTCKYFQPQLCLYPEFQRVVLQQLATITDTPKNIIQMLRRLKIHKSDALRGSMMDALDPAKSEDELQVLEDQLKDREQ